MSARFDCKAALGSGSDSGLGLGTAKVLADRGATVFIAGRRQAERETALVEL